MQPSVFTPLPANGLLLGAVTLAVALACIGQSYVHHLLPERDFVRHNEVGGFIIAVVGSLYAVLLGFLTVSTWQHFADARQLAAQEAAAAADAWHMAVDLPSARRTKIRKDILDYSNIMVSKEWPAMRSSGFDARADVIVMDAIIQAGQLRPVDLGVANAQNATLQQLGVLHDLRQRRLDDNASGIAPFEWLVLLIGAGCVICFCWLFGVTNRRAHLLMTSCVVIVITSLLVLLFELQYPFRTSLGIPPDSWHAVIRHIIVMQTDAQMDMRM
jgi:hypothetical protein